MNLNKSLLDSSSVFIQLSDEEIAQQIVLEKSKNECEQNSYDGDNKSKSNSSQISSLLLTPSVPIQMTQKEAMRLLNLAASIVQANIKRYFQQSIYRKMLQEHKAAVKIQSLWKGYWTRCLNLKLFRKKHDYLLCYVQKQISHLDEKHTKTYNKVINDRNLLVDVVFKLFDEVDKLKTEINILSSNQSIAKNSAVDIVSVPTSRTMEENVKVDDVVVLDESFDNSMDSLNDDKNHCPIEDIANSLVDSVLMESLNDIKIITNQDVKDSSNDSGEIPDNESEIIGGYTEMVNTHDINPESSLDTSMNGIANLDSIEVDVD